MDELFLTLNQASVRYLLSSARTPRRCYRFRPFSFGWAAVGSAAVEVDENVAGFGAFAGAYDSAVLQLVQNQDGEHLSRRDSAMVGGKGWKAV